MVGVFDASQPWSRIDQQLSENPAVDLLVFNKDDIAVDAVRPEGIDLFQLNEGCIPRR